MDFVWAGTEREEGQQDFAACDRRLTALEEHHIRAPVTEPAGEPSRAVQALVMSSVALR